MISKRDLMGNIGNKRVEGVLTLVDDKEKIILPKSKRSTPVLTLKDKQILPKSKRSQVTIFILIGIVVVFGIVAIFLLRDKIFSPGIPAELNAPYTSFQSCVEEKARQGIDLLGTQGGYIYVNELEFEPGNSYVPFSSQLDFLGNPVPYWYYLSSSGKEKEQVPTKTLMEEQLNRYIDENIKYCDFSTYIDQGYEITSDFSKLTSQTKIDSESVRISMQLPLTIKKADKTVLIMEHNININSKLGKFYDTAKGIYEKEQQTLFLENFGVDVLRLYAPVDGFEFSCAPKTWIARNVSDKLRTAIEANTLALKTTDGAYSLKNKENKYLVSPFSGNGENVQFQNSKNWPYLFEVVPSEDQLMIANPVGNQEGLGILGFCYVSYHFVYNVEYPVLVQIYNNNEIFQFPIAVSIKGNKPRKALDTEATGLGDVELCKYKQQEVNVNIYDTALNSVDARISFECLGTKCNIGETKQGVNYKFPQCVNGYILAFAEGYETGRYLISTNKETTADIILNRKYTLNLNPQIDGKNYNGNAIITFSLKDLDGNITGTKTVSYPAQNTVDLIEGNYDVTMQTFSDSSLKLQATNQQQCVDTPSDNAIAAVFGITSKKCYDISIPEQTVSSVLSGGGKTSYYVLESELKDSKNVIINGQSYPLPSSIDQLQENYILAESSNLDVMFK